MRRRFDAERREGGVEEAPCKKNRAESAGSACGDSAGDGSGSQGGPPTEAHDADEEPTDRTNSTTPDRTGPETPDWEAQLSYAMGRYPYPPQWGDLEEEQGPAPEPDTEGYYEWIRWRTEIAFFSDGFSDRALRRRLGLLE